VAKKTPKVLYHAIRHYRTGKLIFPSNAGIVYSFPVPPSTQNHGGLSSPLSAKVPQLITYYINPLIGSHFEKLGFSSAELSEIFTPPPADEGFSGLLERSQRDHQLASLLNQLVEMVTESIENAEAAVRWIVRPAGAFGGKKPWEMLSEEGGLEKIRTHLLQLEHGVYT
jgi:Protein of unknown function (DUF2384)